MFITFSFYLHLHEDALLMYLFWQKKSGKVAIARLLIVICLCEKNSQICDSSENFSCKRKN